MSETTWQAAIATRNEVHFAHTIGDKSPTGLGLSLPARVMWRGLWAAATKTSRGGTGNRVGGPVVKKKANTVL